MEQTEKGMGEEGMILLNPFPIGELRNEIIRTTLEAEDTKDEVGAITVYRFHTVEVILDKRRK